MKQFKDPNKPYVALEDIPGFYNSIIKKGTRLYFKTDGNGDKPIKHNGKTCHRLVFDTIKEAKGHRWPQKENIRCAIWFNNGEPEYNIK